MRTGKISENVLKRSVFKRCKIKNEKVAQGPAIGQDCAIVPVEGKKTVEISTQTVVIDEVCRVRYGIHHAVNNLYCSGAEAIAISLALLLPEDAEEALLREIMDQTDQTCRECEIALAGGHTEVSSAVCQPVLTVTALGAAAEKAHALKELLPGQDLVMTGWTAMEGTALLARKHAAELEKRFPLELVDKAKNFDENLELKTVSEIAWKNGATAMHDVSQGGIFGALWEMCEGAGVGLEADLRKIPIRQETIEICEIYGWNPYCLLSGGSMLIAAGDGQALVSELEKAQILATVIGRTTDKRDKILNNGEECRFLDKPAQDEIQKL